MPVKVDLGVEGLTDNALSIDDKSHAARHESKKSFLHPKQLMYAPIGVAQQQERQLMPLLKPCMRGYIVGTHPDHDRAHVCKHLVAVSEGAGLLGATVGLVFGVKIEHDGLGFQDFGERLWLSMLVEQREVGGGGADGERGHDGETNFLKSCNKVCQRKFFCAATWNAWSLSAFRKR
jgi:hypothetical protein